MKVIKHDVNLGDLPYFDSQCSSEQVLRVIASNLGQKQMWNLQAGGNREGLNFQQIRRFNIPVFSIEEQCSIVKILSTVSDKLNLLETQKAETQQLKKGLMQKLLTGEWRVPLDNPEAA